MQKRSLTVKREFKKNNQCNYLLLEVFLRKDCMYASRSMLPNVILKKKYCRALEIEKARLAGQLHKKRCYCRRGVFKKNRKRYDFITLV